MQGNLMLSVARSILMLLAIGVGATAAVVAESATLDWSAWGGLPVYDAGRVMPLDTFARTRVERICGRERPRLEAAEAETTQAPGQDGAGEGQPLFPGGRPRKFTPDELLFSWLVEPERWEDVPFLIASHEGLRRDLLDVPLVDRRGNRLKYVSPRQFEQAVRAHGRLNALAMMQQESQRRGQSLPLEETDQRLEQLHRAYRAYRELALDPGGPDARRARFVQRLMGALGTWRRQLTQPIALWQSLDAPPEVKELVKGINKAAGELTELIRSESFSPTAAERPVAELCRLSRSLGALAAQAQDRPSDPDNPELAQQRRALMDVLVEQTSRLLGRVYTLREAIHEDGGSVRVVPSLSSFALADDGDMSTRPQPWITLETLLFGSEADLAGYPDAKVAKIRAAFDSARTAYLDRSSKDRGKRFAKATGDLARGLRVLGEAIEPAQRELLVGEVDEKEVKPTDNARLAATAYPRPGKLDRELLYHRLDPFLWAWVLTLAAIVSLLLGFGPLRGATFFLGAGVLAAGQAFTVVGLLLRASVTGMVPVTNMYETVLFTGATVALLGLWFALLPITWPVIAAAWRVTAITASPQTAASAGLSGDNARWFWRTMPLFRGMLAVVVFYGLAIGHFNPSEKGPVFPLLPTFASATPAGLFGATAIWLAGLALLAWSVWFLPRAILTFSLTLTMAPKAVWILCTQRLTAPVEQAVARRAFLLAGAGVALLAYLLAYYVPGPVFDRGIGTGMAAVLRSNFWLALHVLVITASYGAGALAWGLALISLGYYTVGRYSSPPRLSAEAIAAGHRPAG
ncbi:MAG TPA: hypothetical protein VJL29_00460, partial [Thermoguttaceae bacterium]|nr:hypothetical protein [Thermoguttaceae bacterium]